MRSIGAFPHFGLKTRLARLLNGTLEKCGLKLEYSQRDFDDRPIDSFTQQRIIAALASIYQSWITSQRLFEVREKFDAGSASAEFFELWLDTPFRSQQGGSRFNNLLWLFLIARSYQPTLIIDSGTYRGASAWALSLAVPAAQTLSFDIDLTQLALRVPCVRYIESDWSDHTIEINADARVLTYFDDHVDQIRRVIEASDVGCHVAIFDDDFPITSFYAMAPSASVLPKIEFALDRELADGQVLEWISRGERLSIKIDRAYLDRGLARIRDTERLPNTSLITGIHQTPYRVVALDQSRVV